LNFGSKVSHSHDVVNKPYQFKLGTKIFPDESPTRNFNTKTNDLNFKKNKSIRDSEEQSLDIY